jgi:ribosomal protein S12 methylthiotransferase accessory factor
MEAALLSAGIKVGHPATFTVVLTDDYLRPDLHDINREFLASGRPWMMVKPGGFVPWIGPIFRPGLTGCWGCLMQRLSANRQMERYVLGNSNVPGPLVTSRASLPSTTDAAIFLAAVEIERFLMLGPGSDLTGRLLSLDLLNRESREHVLVRRPQCAMCGEELPRPKRPPQSLVLSRHVVGYRSDGGLRTMSPRETFARLKHHVSPILGAVTDLRPAIGKYDPDLTPAFVAGQNFSMGVESVVFLRESLRSLSGGKGTTQLDAKVGALCEALERYSGLWTGEEYSIGGSFEALQPEAIHPNICMGFSDRQYQEREAWNRAQAQPVSRCVVVPLEFDPAALVDWSPAWSLTHNRYRLLPSAYCYHGHPDFAARWSIPDSNGCAAGNRLEEAILQGFMELVERDAVALWWYNRVRRPGVDLDSFDIPYVRAIQRHYESIGRSLWVLDLTSDLGITTFACISARKSGPAQDVLLGFGAHFDPRVALHRAITEVNQFLPTVSKARADGSTIYLFVDELARHWWRTARTEELDYLVPDPRLRAKTRQDYEDRSSDGFSEYVNRCVESAARAGLEVLVLDMTRPDIDLNVVRVIVPGLCHFWRRLGFERLRQVPVSMGWLSRPTESEEFNPYTIFF